MRPNAVQMPRVIIASTASAAGKTTVASGLMAAYRSRGLKVQPFKAGPDYIDPTYHYQASGTVSSNLDSWLTPPSRVLEIFCSRARGADIAIIEGVMGLFDGRSDGQGASTAEIAKILGAPVVLVVDASRMAHSVAALVKGFRDFDSGVRVAGVILNKVSSDRHREVLEQALEAVEMPVLGWLHKSGDLSVPSRHLGLSPAFCASTTGGFWDRLTEQVRANFSLGQLQRVAGEAPPLATPSGIFDSRPPFAAGSIPIGVARDDAFFFYYPESLELLRIFGAEIVPISPLGDERLPDVGALYLGGGYPEVKAAELSANLKFRQDIKRAGAAGLPIYAECGGLMYLSTALLDLDGRSWPMVDAIPVVCRMTEGLKNFGYVTADVLTDNILASRGQQFPGHEFHWSDIECSRSRPPRAYSVMSSRGGSREEGFCSDNLLASYVHLHFAGEPELAANLVTAARNWLANQNRGGVRDGR